MNVLARITQLRQERGWTEYELAKRSGLPQSTISTWYSKNMLPTIASLECICRGFGITLSQFFLEDGEGATILTRQQFRLLSYAARLDPSQYEQLLLFLEALHPSVDTVDSSP